MTTQPEALRLAGRLDLWGDQGDLLEAAAELRRLHAENEALRERVEYWKRKHDDEETGAERDALRAQRDALLEALQDLMQQYKDQPECFMDWSKARAAIAKAEEA